MTVMCPVKRQLRELNTFPCATGENKSLEKCFGSSVDGPDRPMIVFLVQHASYPAVATHLSFACCCSCLLISRRPFQQKFFKCLRCSLQRGRERRGRERGQSFQLVSRFDSLVIGYSYFSLRSVISSGRSRKQRERMARCQISLLFAYFLLF